MNSNYSQPIIVQGTAVPSQPSYDNKASYHNDLPMDEPLHNAGGQSQQQQQQPNEFKDGFWAVAFLLHIAAMFVIISMNIATNDAGGDGDAFVVSSGLWAVVGLTAAVSMGLSSVTILLMMRYPKAMVKVGLVFSTVLVGMMAVMMMMSGETFGIILGIFWFGITICYVVTVWRRIAYAAANLKTALSAVKANAGIAFVAYSIMIIAFAWSGFWMMGIANSLATSNGGIVFLLLVSFYWTFEVLTNTIHVTTAGTVGTWWFVPGEANGCWSKGLTDSLCRATTYSFGSICLGSLLVSVVRALRAMARQARENEDMQLLACLIECILACIEDIIEYFNKWAYVYVGLYGFGYIEAGKNVVQLFQNKGWTTIITDDLCDRVLLMMTFSVGALTALIGMMFGGLVGGENATAIAGLIGLVVGMVVSSILMSVVGSGVNTVIVCFAESPAEFEANHPSLSHEMRSAWVEAWPELSI